ncbi:MAG: hypothetical protein QOK15_1096, partial [Nocardioidaceae bacterium]|nr:hypothetical protein [Nocardioidaceae bacterium]
MSRAATDPTPHRRTGLGWAVFLVLGALLSTMAFAGPAEAHHRHANNTDFRVASFNLLGYSHTGKHGRDGFTDGRTRMGYANRFLNYWGIDVVGFQEFQPEQRATFMSLTGSSWENFPGDTMSRIDMHNSLSWRTAAWQAIEKHTIKIPYFDGEPVDMPYVLLKNIATGRLVWFANFHNPASVYGPAQKWRTEAM